MSEEISIKLKKVTSPEKLLQRQIATEILQTLINYFESPIDKQKKKKIEKLREIYLKNGCRLELNHAKNKPNLLTLAEMTILSRFCGMIEFARQLLGNETIDNFKKDYIFLEAMKLKKG